MLNLLFAGVDHIYENQEMTLEEYEKVLEEKRKTLQTLKTEERKVDAKAFASMQQLANKKANDAVFIKLVRCLWICYVTSCSYCCKSI